MMRAGLRQVVAIVAAAVVLTLGIGMLPSYAAAAQPAPRPQAKHGKAKHGKAKHGKHGKQRRGAVKVRVGGGKFPAAVRLLGPTKTSVVKKAGRKNYAHAVRLKPGSYRVVVSDSYFRGVTYRPRYRHRLVVKASHRTTLKVRFHRVKQAARLETTSLTSTSVSLAWKTRGHAQVRLRRAAGGTAPASVGAGTGIRTPKHGHRAVDRGLAAGHTYSYALFVRHRGHWRRAAVVTAGTAPGAPVSGQPQPAAYELAPNAVVVPAGAERTFVAGGYLWWTPAGRIPPIGAGVALADSPSLPGGYLGTLAEVSADGHSVRLDPAGLGDVFSDYHLNVDLGSSVATSHVVARSGTAAGRVARRGLSGRTSTQDDGPASCGDASASYSTTLHPTFGTGGTASVDVRSKWHVPYQVDFDIEPTITLGATLDISAEARASCKIDLPEVMADLTEAPVPLALRFEPEASISVGGKVDVNDLGMSVTAGFWTKGSVGLHNTADGGLIRQVHPADVRVVASGEAKLTLGGTLTVGPGTGNTEVGAIAGVSGTYDPLVLTGAAVFPIGDSRHDSCLELGVGWDAQLGVRAAAWLGHLSVDKTFTISALNKQGSYLDSPLYYPNQCDDDADVGSGDVEATLSWGSTADLDLHVVDPEGNEIYYGDPTSDTGGTLDVDANAGCDSSIQTDHPIENIYWPTGGAPAGTYRVFVAQYDSCGQTNVHWHLQVRVGGHVVVDQTGDGDSDEFTVTVP